MRSGFGTISPAKLYLALATPLLIVLLVLQPPFQSPDENAHYLRAAHLSQGNLLPENRAGSETGGFVDQALISFVESFLGIPNSPSAKVTRALLSAGERARFSGQQQYAAFPGAAVYPPYAYAAPALAIAVGRAVNASHLRTFHLARTFNVLLGLALCATAIAVAPFGAWAVAGVCLLPMFLAQLASVSADVPIFGFSLLACTLLAREAFRDKPRYPVLFGIAGLIALAAAIRPPMIGLLVPVTAVVWFRGPRSSLQRAATGTALIIFVVGSVLAWTAFAMIGLVDTRISAIVAVDAGRQVRFLLHRPHVLPFIAYATIATYWQFYLESMIGLLGWLDTPLEDWFYFLSGAFVLGLAMVSISDEAQPPVWFAVMVVLGVLFSAGLIFAALYVGWSAVGAPVVQGVQGRYFLPLLAALVLVCPRFLRNVAMRRRQEMAQTLLVLYALTTLGHVTWSVVRRYYLA